MQALGPIIASRVANRYDFGARLMWRDGALMDGASPPTWMRRSEKSVRRYRLQLGVVAQNLWNLRRIWALPLPAG